MRTYATEKGLFDKNNKLHHSAMVYDDEFDRQVDFGIREKLSEETHWIIESWLSGFLAQGVPNVLKVLMICSDKAVKVDRLVNRDGMTIDEALSHIEQRYQENLRKWQRLYAQQWQEWVVKPGKVASNQPIDFWREDLYDLVLDTYSLNQEQVTQAVIDAIKKAKDQQS